MVGEWFCQVMGSEVGPLSQRQLVDMVRKHRVNPEDLVRRNDSSWVPAFEVKGLFEAAAKPEAPLSAAPAEEMPQPEKVSEAKAAAKHLAPDKTSPMANPTAIPRGTKDEAATDWFCIASGEKQGPLGFDALKSLAEDGSLRGKDRVWRAAWPKFRKAGEVDGLETLS